MRKLLIATRNQGKLKEFAQIIKLPGYELITLDDTEVDPEFDVEENGTTFAANARLKAESYGRRTKLLTLADDSGLVVEALHGNPGVFSKRYGKTDEERNKKLLKEMKYVPDNQRQAKFVCVMCLYNPDNAHFNSEEGVVEGSISLEPRGTEGFGYDPVFMPLEGDGKTFAELGLEFKNLVSHRARALEKIKDQLLSLAE